MGCMLKTMSWHSGFKVCNDLTHLFPGYLFPTFITTVFRNQWTVILEVFLYHNFYYNHNADSSNNYARTVYLTYSFISDKFLAPLALHRSVATLAHMHTHFTPGQLLLAAICKVRTRDDGKLADICMILREIHLITFYTAANSYLQQILTL